MKPSSASRRLFLFLLIFCACAGAATAYEWQRLNRTDFAATAIPIQPFKHQPVIPEQKITLPAPISAYKEIAARPLFFESRRPVPKVAPPKPVARVKPARAPVRKPKPAKAKPPNIRLSGAILAPDSSVAIIRVNGGNEVRYIAEGMEIQGWKVAEIRTTSIVLIRAEQEHIVDIHIEKPSPPGSRRKTR